MIGQFQFEWRIIHDAMIVQEGSRGFSLFGVPDLSPHVKLCDIIRIGEERGEGYVVISVCNDGDISHWSIDVRATSSRCV